jgi:hypothetical protein
LKPSQDISNPKGPKDRIEGNRIILDAAGHFPKEVIVIDAQTKKEYRIVKTKKGGYLLQ